MSEIISKAAAIVAVDGGRGFVVQGDRDHRYIVTAAHCLQRGGEPYMPPAIGGISYTHERTYPNLLGPIGGEPTVWAECLFADPIADVAVLGSPDDQELSEEAEAYSALVDAAELLPLGEPVWREGDVRTLPAELGAPERRLVAFYEAPAWLLSLDCRWFRCTVRHGGGRLSIRDAAEGIVGGMSGSPIVSENGWAIGIVCTGTGPMSIHPRLSRDLPGWALNEFGWHQGGEAP